MKTGDFRIVKKQSTYIVPTYKLANKGLVETGELRIPFVNGKEGDEQEGTISENLLVMMINHTKSLNVGNLKNKFTEDAIEHLTAALKCLIDRKIDRQERNVLGTYNK